MLRFLTFLAAIFAPAVALAQPSPLGCPPGIVPCTAIMQFQPIGAPYSLSVSTTSSNVALTAAASNYSALISNSGSNAAYVTLGGSSVTATVAAGVYVAAGGAVVLPLGTATYLAAITSTSTTTLAVSIGPGAPQVVYTQGGSGGGGGGTVTANQGTPGTAWPVTTTVAPVAYAASTSASVGTTSGTLITAGAYTQFLQICTLASSTSNVWLNPTGSAAAASSGVPIFAGGGCVNFGAPLFPMPTAAITAITDGGSSQTVVIAGK